MVTGQRRTTGATCHVDQVLEIYWCPLSPSVHQWLHLQHGRFSCMRMAPCLKHLLWPSVFLPQGVQTPAKSPTQWELRDQLNAPAFHSSFFAEAILRCILHNPLRAQEGWSPRCHSSSPITPTLSLSHFPATHSCFLRPFPI